MVTGQTRSIYNSETSTCEFSFGIKLPNDRTKSKIDIHVVVSPYEKLTNISNNQATHAFVSSARGFSVFHSLASSNSCRPSVQQTSNTIKEKSGMYSTSDSIYEPEERDQLERAGKLRSRG
jgi:hypothetical protein